LSLASLEADEHNDGGSDSELDSDADYSDSESESGRRAAAAWGRRRRGAQWSTATRLRTFVAFALLDVALDAAQQALLTAPAAGSPGDDGPASASVGVALALMGAVANAAQAAVLCSLFAAPLDLRRALRAIAGAFHLGATH